MSTVQFAWQRSLFLYQCVYQPILIYNKMYNVCPFVWKSSGNIVSVSAVASGYFIGGWETPIPPPKKKKLVFILCNQKQISGIKINFAKE